MTETITPAMRKDLHILAVIRAFNVDPNRPFDEIGGQKVYYRARLPILATDCDYEIVSISGVQGKRVPA